MSTKVDSGLLWMQDRDHGVLASNGDTRDMILTASIVSMNKKSIIPK